MLKVPQKVDLALVLMRILADGQSASQTVSLDGVARQEGISQGYLEEVARLLRSAKLVSGRRGAGGGYVLTRPASEITVADVVTAILGGTWTTECLGEKLEKYRRVTTKALWKKVQGQVMTTLRGVTIAETR